MIIKFKIVIVNVMLYSNIIITYSPDYRAESGKNARSLLKTML